MVLTESPFPSGRCCFTSIDITELPMSWTAAYDKTVSNRVVLWNVITVHIFHIRRTETNCSLVNSRRSLYRGADKSLARPTSRCILFDGENVSFDASLVIYINSTNIPPKYLYSSYK